MARQHLGKRKFFSTQGIASMATQFVGPGTLISDFHSDIDLNGEVILTLMSRVNGPLDKTEPDVK